MPRLTVHHLTPPRRLPLIEEEGLRTRADLSERLGPIDAFDQAAPGTFAHGKRVSAWLSVDHARTRVDELGAGYVSFTVDPAKTLAASAATRGDDVEAYWAGARPLSAWLADGDPPEDLEVHQNLPVRTKHLRIHAPMIGDEALAEFAPLVRAVADRDRLSAKAMMHLAVIASEGDFDSPAFLAACALAWRDEPDSDRLLRELMELDPDKVASAALAERSADAPEAVATLRDALTSTREWGEENGLEPGRAIFGRTSLVLERLPQHV